MNKSEPLHYKNPHRAKQQELTSGKGLVTSISTAGEPCGDALEIAVNETGAAIQIRLNQTDSKLLGATEEALARTRQGRSST